MLKVRTRLFRVIFAINLLFWVWLWLDIRMNLQPYTQAEVHFEEIVPVYKFGSLAVPSRIDHRMLSLKVMRVIHQPLHFILVKLVNASGHGDWDKKYGALSIGSYLLISTMIGSFAQWLGLAWLIEKLFLRARRLEKPRSGDIQTAS